MKHTTTLIAFLFICICSQAQAPRGFSILAGVNQMSLESDDLLADSGIGFKTGLIFNMGYHETYNYQFEVLYKMGSLEMLTVDQNYNPSSGFKYSSHAIELGAYFNYYILKPDEDKFYVGPQIGITASYATPMVESADESNSLVLPHLVPEENLDNISKYYYGAGLGITGGYNDFRFDLRYTLGLNNMLADVQTGSFDEFNRYTGPELEGKIHSISFSINYRIAKLFGGE